jgi:hypothetical protein
MSPAAKISLYGGVALTLGAVTWLWGQRGMAIVLDYVFVGCM